MAEEKGSKAASTYKKVRSCPSAFLSSRTGPADPPRIAQQAARSFEKCPITFTHPDEAAQLEYVGVGIIKMLTGKLKDYCEQTGEPFPERGQSRPSAQLAGASSAHRALSHSWTASKRAQGEHQEAQEGPDERRRAGGGSGSRCSATAHARRGCSSPSWSRSAPSLRGLPTPCKAQDQGLHPSQRLGILRHSARSVPQCDLRGSSSMDAQAQSHRGRYPVQRYIVGEAFGGEEWRHRVGSWVPHGLEQHEDT